MITEISDSQTDNHRFRLFWAPLAQLPALVTPQRWWLDILLRSSLDGLSLD